MSTIGTYRTIFGDETGADGRAVTDVDLNTISTNMTRRAWEVPGYAGLIGFDQISSSGPRTYSAAFDGDATAMYSRIRGVYTFGRGLEVTPSGMGTSVGSGFLGCYMDGSTPSRPPASGAAKMHWVEVASGDIAYTHDLAAAGKMRWDLITVQLSETNASTVARHFQDAVTGAISSQNVIPARVMAMQATITKGTEDTTTPLVPDAPTNGHVLYAVKVSDAAILDVWDFTVPVGNLQDGVTMGFEGTCYTSEVSSPAWVIAQNTPFIKSVTSASGDLLLFPPPAAVGSSARLLLGVEIKHKLYSGSTVKFSAFELGTGVTALTDIVDVSASVTKDGSIRAKYLDMRGFPYSAQSQPIWMNGTSRKRAVDSTVCLRINAESATNVSYVYNVRWFYL